MENRRGELIPELMPGLEPELFTQLDEHMRRYVCDAHGDMELYRMMAFQMGWSEHRGREGATSSKSRLYGQTVLAARIALGGEAGEADLWRATAMELMWHFYLVHNDIHEANTEHHERASLWWQWGPSQAINTGDGLHAMSRLALFNAFGTPPTPGLQGALQLFDTTILRLCEGGYLDIDTQERLDVKEDTYFDIAARIDGGLLGCALGLAVAEHGDERLMDALRGYGELIGTARRVRRDADALWGERRGDDLGALITKRKTLPVVHVLNGADLKSKRRLAELYAQRVVSVQALEEVAAITADAGARERCEGARRELATRAEERLAGLDKARRKVIMVIGERFEEMDTQ